MSVAPAAPSPSRRSLIRAGLAGLAGLALGALGRPTRAQAAPGGSVLMGQGNDAGTTNTSLTTSTNTGTALLVTQNGTATALRGVAGNGIAGFFTSANGSGVSGVVAAGNKYGVYAGNDAATAGTGAALRASGQQNHGIVATTANGTRAAVRAVNTMTGAAWQTGPAVRGLSAGATDDAFALVIQPAAGEFAGVVGVAGIAATGQSDGVGVCGITDGTDGYAIEGYATAFTGHATGVYGASGAFQGHGVAGYTLGSGDGVYAYSDSASYALMCYGPGHVYGNFSVNGTLSKTAGSFKIDHPLDPANKYLLHSFVESPDMLNVYCGTATLDGGGEATVELPAWFDALNKDIHYQLTPVGGAAPELHVKSEVAKGRFAIGGGAAGQRVSWQLTGVRKDAYAEAHRIQVEVDKPERERGLYLHPVEHGRPESTGMDVRYHKHEPRPMPGADSRQASRG